MNNKHFFIIVNYNSGDEILSCIQSILQSKNITPLIIVIDNASRDSSIENCKQKFPNLIYIYNTHNIGFSAAVNMGIRYALERFASTITLCNPDATLDANCAHRLIESSLKKGIHIASPVIYADEFRNKIWFCSGKIDYVHMRTTHQMIDFSQSVKTFIDTDYITGCVMTVAADVFRQVGLFDEKFFLYYEDADFSIRALKRGYRIAVIPNAHAFHSEISEKNKENKTYFLVLSGLLFFHKHTRGFLRLWFRMHLLLRKIKNSHALKKNIPLANIVHKAYQDYGKQRS